MSPPQAPDSVRVSCDDLSWALAYMAVDGQHGQDVKDRLTRALETARNDGEVSAP